MSSSEITHTSKNPKTQTKHQSNKTKKVKNNNKRSHVLRSISIWKAASQNISSCGQAFERLCAAMSAGKHNTGTGDSEQEPKSRNLLL